MSKSINVLFTSRHNLTEEQLSDLQNLFEGFQLDIKTMNVTYKTKGSDALSQLIGLCKEEKTDVLIGVLPAHIAANVATSSTYDYGDLRIFDGLGQKTIVLVPVNEEVSATDDGKQRRFKHSHFEVIAGFDLIQRIGADPYKFI